MSAQFDFGEAAAPAPPLETVWMTTAEIARRKGVSRQAVHERVKALAADGRLEVRAGKGRERLVNLVAYDKAIGAVGDPAREAGAVTKAEDARALAGAPAREGAGGLPLGVGGEGVVSPADPTFRDARTQGAVYDAELKRIAIEEKLGKLVPVDEVAAAMTKCAEAIVRAFDRLPARADELAGIATKEGAVGVRGALKGVCRELRQVLADQMKLLAAGTDASDEQPDMPS
jgi:DNA-binding Lrp family transcriptional regulator